MASRRMFSLDVVDTDKFLDMHLTAQCIYFHYGDGVLVDTERIWWIVWILKERGLMDWYFKK